jgi:glycosidase/fibronectin type 3 domain-containing protein
MLFALLFALLPIQQVGAATTNPGTAAFASPVADTRPPAIDGDIFWDGLGHDSRDPLYRTPPGAVTANSQVTLRFRTFSNDATGVTLRTYHTGLSAERLYEMQRVAIGVSCYDPRLTFTCDFWQATIDVSRIGTLYYRFIVKDGAKTVFYEDDSDVRDGGWGKPFDNSFDWGWVITVYDPKFNTAIRWMKEGVVYQIFPDRFANGDRKNDPTPDPANPRLSKDPRYAYPNGDPAGASKAEWDQIVRMDWDDLPEGYCRNYQDITAVDCPKRFAQPGAATDKEQPRGRDYYGGDLKGVTKKLGYLKELGVTVIYFNPIFSAASNHRYDTRDYRIVDPYLGDLGDWQTLERAAQENGIRIILDGVFNHMSSDSPLFDRYHNWGTLGACEDVNSPYRKWFRFRKPNANEPAACAPYTRDGDSFYASWAGFDSLPQLSEDPAVKDMIFSGQDNVAQYWIKQGADGWRLDVMQDKSIPFWEGFRSQVKRANPEAIIIGELWKKFDVLPYVTGNTADTAMNYRLRDAVIGLLAPGPYDSKGFPGSGQPIQASSFANRLQSVREDYPDAAYYSLMNLLDSHDTERVLWTLTPGVENRQGRELNAANLAEGKQRQRLAALIQMTMPGAPTVYYGDEVGVTGDDDPDDRRTYPWEGNQDTGKPNDKGGRKQGDAPRPDKDMLRYYQELTHLRAGNQALIDGPLRFLLADDANGVVAYGRKQGDDAAVVLVNAGEQPRSVSIPVAGYLPNGTQLASVAGLTGQTFTVQNGAIAIQLPALSGVALMTRGADLTPTAAPTNLRAAANGLVVSLNWDGVAGAAGYNVYRSPVSGGGYVKLNGTPLAATSFTDNGADLRGGQRYYYTVKALDDVGNESAPSNEASAVPNYRIGWANLQWPPTLNYTVSAQTTTDTVYGQVWIDGVTNRPGATPGLQAQLGYGPRGSDPRTWTTWVAMEFNVDAGNNDEFKGALQPTQPGVYSYFTRYSTNAGESWIYGDLDGIGDGSFAQQTNKPGVLTVNASSDQTPPAAPINLQAFNNGATSIRLTWGAPADTDLARYDVYRSVTAGSSYTKVGSVQAGTTSFADAALQTGTRYYYVVRAVDASNNESPPSSEASAIPEARNVPVTFEVTVPAGTPADQTVYIVGSQPQICNWCSPQTTTLTKGADGKWRVTLTFLEGTLVNYKYTLGSWDFVEKDAACGEIGDRALRVIAGTNGTELVQDTVANWRNVKPCGG